MLRTWAAAFPGVVKPASAISDSLRSHFRYPEDLFKVQRELLTEYHVDNPGEFFSTVSFWDVPSDPTVQGAAGTAGSAQPPYYLLAGLPEPAGRDLPAHQRAGQPGAAVPLGVRDRELGSRHATARSPCSSCRRRRRRSARNRCRRSSSAHRRSAQQLNLLRQNQTTIEYGNLLTLPVAGGLLYVEPVYIERAGQSASYPVLARVLVSYNGRVGYDASLGGRWKTCSAPGAGSAVDPAGAAAATRPRRARRCRPRTRRTRTRRRPRRRSQQAIGQLKAAQQSGDFAAQGQALAALDAGGAALPAGAAGRPADRAPARGAGGGAGRLTDRDRRTGDTGLATSLVSPSRRSRATAARPPRCRPRSGV